MNTQSIPPLPQPNNGVGDLSYVVQSVNLSFLAVIDHLSSDALRLTLQDHTNVQNEWHKCHTTFTRLLWRSRVISEDISNAAEEFVENISGTLPHTRLDFSEVQRHSSKYRKNVDRSQNKAKRIVDGFFALSIRVESFGQSLENKRNPAPFRRLLTYFKHGDILRMADLLSEIQQEIASIKNSLRRLAISGMDSSLAGTIALNIQNEQAGRHNAHGHSRQTWISIDLSIAEVQTRTACMNEKVMTLVSLWLTVAAELHSVKNELDFVEQSPNEWYMSQAFAARLRLARELYITTGELSHEAYIAAGCQQSILKVE
ncbi:unnamed protein product [Somion occarium]|uniref:Uncharacterized protein n=1 Tax=Somion occarium TaxID=3059160 RepID=A0ABP1E7W6_9APHY